MHAPAAQHGSAGRREHSFSRLLARRLVPYRDEELTVLAAAMVAEPDAPSNDPEPEENLAVPSGYTYLGQFIDHDLTFETTSAFGSNQAPTNVRTPRLDLDSLYGAGPNDQPYMYATHTGDGLRKGASLVPGRALAGSPGRHDLLRVGSGRQARAVIGDPRNDENTLICNLHAAFIAFHNALVNDVGKRYPGLSDREAFERSRQLLRWTYQRIVIDDYLPRIVAPATYSTFRHRLDQQGEGAFRLYTPDKRGAIPIEFAGAAYRFGHSMVRPGYKLNAVHAPQLIFTPGDGDDSLVGFGPLLENHWVDWRRFFPINNEFSALGERPAQNVNTAPDRLQWAYRIDTTLVDPLRLLPTTVGAGMSLADLNLRRGNLFGIVSGQTFAAALGVPALDHVYLVTRAGDEEGVRFRPIGTQFLNDTPLWLYVLAEAQRELVDAWIGKGGTYDGDVVLTESDMLLGIAGPDDRRQRAPVAQLGPVGGMILMETLFGLLLADPTSVLRIGTPEQRLWHDDWFAVFTDGGKAEVSMWQLLTFAGLT